MTIHYKTSDFQEIFDGVCAQLAKQGGPSMAFIKTKYDLDGSTACAYRGANGRMCALGVLIPDEEYNPKHEGEGAQSVLAELDKSFISPSGDTVFTEESNVIEQRKRFINNIQSAHDTAANYWGAEKSETAPWYKTVAHNGSELLITRQLSYLADQYGLDKSALAAFSSCAESAPTVRI